jgi:hypothetical protein
MVNDLSLANMNGVDQAGFGSSIPAGQENTVQRALFTAPGLPNPT